VFFEKLAHLTVRRSKLLLFLFIILLPIVGGLGSLVFHKLDSEGHADPSSDSFKVTEYLKKEFKAQEPGVILIVDAQNRSVNDPSVVQDVQLLEKSLNDMTQVTHTVSYWSAHNPPNLVSKDGKAAYLFVFTEDLSPKMADSFGKEIQQKFDGDFKSLKVYATGKDIITSSLNRNVAKDLLLAEFISIPLTFIFLLIVFGTLVAASVPLFVGIFAILGSFFLLWIIASFTSVSVFALNLVTGLGLGLGIDYSLLIVSRFREELSRRFLVSRAVVATVQTAGKTVFYSGLTVMVTLGSLILFPQPFLKSFGYAGISVVLLAIISALLPLPALLNILGRCIDKGVIRKSAIITKNEGGWAKTARFVMKRPISIALLCFLMLGVFSFPVRNIVFSQTDARILPATDKSVLAYEVMNERFSTQESNPIEIIIPNGALKQDKVNQYMTHLSKINGISHINPMQTHNDDVKITSIQSFSPRTTDAKKMIQEIRALDEVENALVGGVSADFVDSQNGINKTLPSAFLWIALSVMILIFIFTGSLILPLKAVLLNGFSLIATMGVITYIFVEGHLKWLVGEFTTTGAIDTGTSILVTAVVFGLSMDYELFLLSRIKEEHRAGKSNQDAVAFGLQKSARIITAAALILAVVFAAFMTSGVTPIKLMGFGISFAVLLDATIIRAFLVPALMRLFGRFNWWAPKFLQKFTIDH